jgi:hypothetical protein
VGFVLIVCVECDLSVKSQCLGGGHRVACRKASRNEVERTPTRGAPKPLWSRIVASWPIWAAVAESSRSFGIFLAASCSTRAKPDSAIQRSGVADFRGSLHVGVHAVPASQITGGPGAD